MIGGNPALRRLAWLKLRGTFRRQLRKLRTLSGCLFAGVGALISFSWIASLIFGRTAFSRESSMPEDMLPWAQLGVTVFGVFTLVTATSLRGVYFPKQDIERLFAAPASRSDLVRFRMLVDLGRTVFGAIVLGLLTFHRMPVPGFGLVGAILTFLTLGVLRQAVSILLGGAQSRAIRFLNGKGAGFVRILVGIGIWMLIMAAIFGGKFIGKVFGDVDVVGQGALLFETTWAQVLLAPAYPYGRLMTATGGGEFAMWLGVCLLITFALYEGTARMPIDYREHSLETSERINKRLTQIRRGGLFSGGAVSSKTARWRMPRLFGNGPVGAVSWIKLVSIVRKARGTLLVGLLIVTLVTGGISFVMGNDPDELSVLGSALIAFLGITYLGGALRFDFRADLDRMVQIKAWPVAPQRVFVGTLVPQVALISVMLGLAIWTRLAVLRLADPISMAIPLVLPFFAFAWLAVDNAVFLFAPVRLVPGQEGSLHHTGRAILLFLLRMIIIGVILGLVAATAAVLFTLGPEELGLSELQAGWISAGVGFVVLLAFDLLLAWVGGRMLQRFDVARDVG